jgi:CRP-like cAMP-binding protein
VAAETSAGRPLELDDLLLLRAATDRGVVDRWSGAAVLQAAAEEAADRLVSLRERGLLCPEGRGAGTAYRLTRRLSDALRGPSQTDRDMSLDHESVALRVQKILAERGRLTNAQVRQLSGYSRAEVVRLVRSLREEGLLEITGRGRGAHYEPSLKLLAGMKRGRRRP